MKYVLLILLCALVPVFGQAKEKLNDLNIVFIGNSITQGALLENPAEEAPPVQAVRWLRQQPGISSVEYANQGVSGKTTVDFLPASGTYFAEVQKAADRFYSGERPLLLFSVMLGTNDSAIRGPNGSPVSAPQYRTNVKVIVDELLARYPRCKVVLHRPVWYSPNTYNSSMYLLEGLRRLEGYLPELQALVQQYAGSHPRQVFMGDALAFDYFRENYQTDLTPENGNAGTFYLHPNRKGAERLGEFWGQAIYRIIGE